MDLYILYICNWFIMISLNMCSKNGLELIKIFIVFLHRHLVWCNFLKHTLWTHKWSTFRSQFTSWNPSEQFHRQAKGLALSLLHDLVKTVQIGFGNGKLMKTMADARALACVCACKTAKSQEIEVSRFSDHQRLHRSIRTQRAGWVHFWTSDSVNTSFCTAGRKTS